MSKLNRASRQLAYLLRHHPAGSDLTRDGQGWCSTSQVLGCLAARGAAITLEQLQQLVATDSKTRYAFSEDGTRIKAHQGHSVADVGIEYEVGEPPPLLYHGTTAEAWAIIKEEGLKPMGRHHVHLTADLQTARNRAGVGGKEPQVLLVDTRALMNEGAVFFVTANDVWLSCHVPPCGITPIKA